MNGITYKPGYLNLHRRGPLRERGELLWDRLQSCDPEDLAGMMLGLQEEGCQNIKLSIPPPGFY